MKINRIRVFKYELPLAGALCVKSETRSSRSGFLLKMESDHGDGWGEAAPLPGISIDQPDDVARYLSEICQELKGFQVEDELPAPSFFNDALADAPPSARFGIEQALLSLLAAARNIPLRSLLADDASDTVAVNALLAGPREQVIAAAHAAVDAGYRCAKLKVGRTSVDDETALVCEVRNILGDRVALRLDANRAWTLGEALAFGKRLDVPVNYIEEPLKNPAQIPSFAAETGLPVALDETLADTPWSVWTAFEGVAAVVLKPTILGGIYRARRIASHAAARGQMAVVSSSFESGVGFGGLCELAAAFGGIVAAGLDTYRWLNDDVLQRRPAVGPSLDLAAVSVALRTIDESKLIEMEHG